MSRRVVGACIRWVFVAASALLLLVGSLIPLPTRYNPDFGPYGPDKALHLLGHLGLAAALAAALEDDGPSRHTALAAVAISTVFGVSTELLQEAVPGREFERGDVNAGLVGSLAGVLAWGLFRRGRRADSGGESGRRPGRDGPRTNS